MMSLCSVLRLPCPVVRPPPARSYTKLTNKQYLELKVRIKKLPILYFYLQSAQDNALEDCKMEIERENNDRKYTSQRNRVGIEEKQEIIGATSG